MAENNNVQNTLETIMGNLKTMVNSNSIMGDPVTMPDGTIIIPISKINYGFASGGGNLNGATKNNMEGLGAGGGGGITVSPVGFLTIKDGVTKMLQVEPYASSADRVIEKMPEIMEKVGGYLDEKKEEHAIKKEEKKAQKELAKQEKAAAKAAAKGF